MISPRTRRESRERRRYRRRIRRIMAHVPNPCGSIDRYLAALRAAADEIGTLRDAMYDEHWRPRYPARRDLDTILLEARHADSHP